jgi:hypothetical protein
MLKSLVERPAAKYFRPYNFTIFVKILYLFLLWRRNRSTQSLIAPAKGPVPGSFGRIRAFVSFASVVAAALLALSLQARAAPWRGVVPMKSDKKSVRAILGKPTVETEDRMEFNRREGHVVVFFYTAGDAAELKLLPAVAGRVLLVYVYPKVPREYDRDELAVKAGKVGRGVTIEGEPMTSYDDGKRGISYHFIRDATRVWRIAYYAPASQFARYKIKEARG